MISRTLAAGLVAASVTAAAAGAYVGVRQNAAAVAPAAQAEAVPDTRAASAGAAEAPVSETEAVVSPRPVEAEAPVEVERPAPEPRRAVVPARDVRRTREAAAIRSTQPDRRTPAPQPEAVPVVDPGSALPAPAIPSPIAPEPLPLPELPPDPPARVFEELVIPSSSVIGLQVETSLTSERARVEDRVDARVTRDVLAAGRVAIPAGARVIGAVTIVERGGKVKERARLGVRFHTVVLADGSQVPLRTDAILREGDAPSGESARKIGGAAVGGAILGAIMGGKKGAVIGGATGAGAGTAAVMAGDRNAATLPAGTVVTVRLTAPASIEVERR